MILDRDRGRLATTDRYVRPLRGVHQPSVNRKSPAIRSFPTLSLILLHIRSNPHDYQIRWLWFLLSLACAAVNRWSRRNKSWNQVLFNLVKTSTHPRDPMSSDRARCSSMRIYRFFPGQKPRRMWLSKVCMVSRTFM